jgi:hypothetical protein
LGSRAGANAEEFSVLGRARYDATVLGLGNLGRRLLESAVGLFALLGFVYVPLGRQTGFEHARAVFSTPAAIAAIEDVSSSVLRLRQRTVDIFTGRASPPAPRAKHQTDQGNYNEPRPTPPKLK